MELQIVELHFRQAPRVDYIAVKERAETILGYTLDAPKTTNKTDDVCLFFHTGHIVKYAEGEVPAQTAVLSANKPIDLNYYSQDIQQSWASRNAESLLEGSTHTLIVTEMMARGLEPKDRIQIFHGVLQALIEKTAPRR